METQGMVQHSHSSLLATCLYLSCVDKEAKIHTFSNLSLNRGE